MKQHQDFANTIHRELCVIPAPSHYEGRCATYCAEKLRSLGFDNVFVDDAKNVICELKTDQTHQTVIFAAHTDVVFPDMESLPLREDDENIYCPGAGDDTVCVAQLMSVMKKNQRHWERTTLQCGFYPQCLRGRIGQPKGYSRRHGALRQFCGCLLHL